ncbi:helix-turn-helix transcriptional regulator [Streptomyces albus subsp. chlorinus]|uniref:helix-turn-helix domain-containing protein n=1 Tax=Streptomyces albus TaxID=1888 RepID=UPI00156D47A5|nr:helix-turn-helix transcriptional regulator [Streptomyces albus subsp. chlorinus]
MHEGFETSIGDRIGRLRTRRGLTQERLAELADVCVDTVRKLEQNRRQTARMATLNRLARALDVDVSVLVGSPVTFEPRPDGSAPSVLALRRAVSPVSDLFGGDADEPDADPEDPPAVGALRASLRATESTRREGRMGEVGSVLPQLIRDARAAVRAYEGSERDRAAAYAVLAEAYQVAATTLTALGNPDAAFTAMERATAAARRSDDPHLEAIGAATLAWIFTKQGRLEDAETVALGHADRIEPTFRSHPLDLSLWGILLLRAATALVRQGERRYDRVEDLLRMATAAAARIGADRLDYATPFGPTNTAVATVNFQVEMDRPSPALTTARAVPGLRSLPPTWRARFHVDRALAHAGLGQDESATRALLAAERDAPEWMRYHGTTRRLVADLHARERRRTSPLTQLADRLGVER